MRTLYFSKHLALASIGLAAIFAINAQAVEQIKPQIDASALPALGWHEPNPLRGNAEAAAIGYTGLPWIKQYYQGKRQLEATLARQRAMGQQTVAIPKPVVG